MWNVYCRRWSHQDGGVRGSFLVCFCHFPTSCLDPTNIRSTFLFTLIDRNHFHGTLVNSPCVRSMPRNGSTAVASRSPSHQRLTLATTTSSPVSKSLLVNKNSALQTTPFRNDPPPPPLFKRTSYKSLMFVLFLVALVFFTLSVTAAVFMLIAVGVSVIGSYTSMRSLRRTTRKLFGIPTIMYGAQGVATLIYVVSFWITLSNQTSQGSSGTTTYG